MIVLPRLLFLPLLHARSIKYFFTYTSSLEDLPAKFHSPRWAFSLLLSAPGTSSRLLTRSSFLSLLMGMHARDETLRVCQSVTAAAGWGESRRPLTHSRSPPPARQPACSRDLVVCAHASRRRRSPKWCFTPSSADHYNSCVYARIMKVN